MKKVFLVALPIMFGTIGCASTSQNTSKVSSNVIEFKSMHPKQYKLNDVNIRLETLIQKEGYLTKENIQQVYIDALNKELITQNKNTKDTNDNVALVDLDLIHKRVFMGEGFKFVGGEKLVTGYADTVFTYRIKVTYKGEVVQTYKTGKLLTRKGGIIGNFQKMGRDLSGGGTPKNELDDLNKAAKGIIASLSQ